ncbi:hypothetical protein AYK24_04720 [Thermoplasmatales archaeon SG8-52-4]|nr:MAG: hypothetical protein AYK24_04720 [Thermoplasmatales archaeon SG8-52-4]
MTDDFDPHLSCEEKKKSKDVPGYISKSIIFDSDRYSDIITPYKIIDIQSLSRRTLSIFSNLKYNIIFESPKYIWQPQTYSAINDINEGYVNDTNRFLGILGLKPLLSDNIRNSMSIGSVAFHRNPFKERISSSSGKAYPQLNINSFATFLNNLYAYSKGMVLVPDINITRIPKMGLTIEPSEYLKIIEYFTTILSERNNKPIFVPIQTNLTKKATEEILVFYKSKRYKNIWINFSGGEVGGRHLSGFRSILNILDKQYPKNDYVLFCSHMQKEISPDIREYKAPSSDMLSQFIGVDFIGSTREPVKGFSADFDLDEYIKKLGFSDKKNYEEARKLHRSRIFDPLSYYYFSPKHYPNLPGKLNRNDLINDENINKSVDNFIKFREIENVKGMVNDGKNLKNYLKNKTMFNESKEIFNEIIDYFPKKTKRTKSLFDF